MIRIKSLLAGSTFLRSAALLAGSTVLGQGLVLLIQPLLTRLYRPEDFGLLALYTSILSLLAVVVNLRYEQAIQLPKEEVEARSLLALSLLIGIVISLLVGGVFWFLRDSFAKWFGITLPGFFILLLVLGLICVAIMQAGSMWALRMAQFRALAQTKLQQGIWQAVGQVALAVFKGPTGLLLGDVLGRLGGVQVLLRLLPGFVGLSIQTLWNTARRYQSFLFFGAGAALFTAASFHLPFILLTAHFGTAAMGQFSLSYRITTIPVTLVAQSIGQVFFFRAAAVRASTNLAKLTEQTAAALFMLGLPIFGSLFVVAPQVFPQIFGNNWAEAGIYAQLLAPYLLLSFVAQPLSHLLTVREWQKMLFVFTAFELLLRLGAIFWGVSTQQMYWAVVLFSTSSALIAALSLMLFFRAAGARWVVFWSRVAPITVANSLLLLLLWFASQHISGWNLLALTVLSTGTALLCTGMGWRQEGLR